MNEQWLSGFVKSGHIVDVIFFFIAVEAISLGAYRLLTGRGLTIGDMLANLSSGVCLLVALRFALAGSPWQMIVIAVCGSLAAHLYDLSRRWDNREKIGLLGRTN